MNDLRGGMFAFGPFRLDSGQRMLWRNGDHLPLTPKEFETLLVLVENAGQLVGKEDIISRVWPDTFVSDSSLTRNVSVLRKVLGDDVIQTLPKFGYRLTLAVSRVTAVPDPVDQVVTPPPVVAAMSSSPTGGHRPPLQRAGQAPPLHPTPAGIAPGGRLRRRAGVVLAVLTAAAVYAGYREAAALRGRPKPASGPIRIAVLPFTNLTGDPQQEYVCDGLTEAMISELSRLSPGQLDVIARTSAMQYKHTDKSVPQIGRELRVDYVLESSLRESGKMIRVTTQLVRAADAGHVWTGEYDRDLEDVLSLQEQVAIAIGEEIELKLAPPAKARLPSPRTVDAEAYREYLLGRFYWNRRDRDGLLRSVNYFNQAIARDAGYGAAYAGLADAYLVLGGGYLPDRESYGKARIAALKALELDPTLADAHCSLAYEKYVNEWDWQGAEDDFQRALSLDPGYATAHHWYALYLAAMLRPEEAVREIKRALELDPLSVAINYGAGTVFTQAGRHDEAIGQLKKALEIDPGNAVTHGALAVAYERKKLYEKAAVEFETAQRLQGGYSPYAIEVAHVYVTDGRTAKAQAILRDLLADGKWAKASPMSFARVYASLGEKEAAFRWLQKSIDDRSCTVAEVNTDRDLDPLRSDPRFEQIRRQFRLPNQ